MTVIAGTTPRPGDPRLAARLARETTGEVLFGRADRGRYATDASIYQQEPLGVLVPRSTAEAAHKHPMADVFVNYASFRR